MDVLDALTRQAYTLLPRNLPIQIRFLISRRHPRIHRSS